MKQKTKIFFLILGCIILLREFGFIHYNWWKFKSTNNVELMNIQEGIFAGQKLVVSFKWNNGKTTVMSIGTGEERKIEFRQTEFSGVNFFNFNIFYRNVEPLLKMDCFDVASGRYLGNVIIRNHYFEIRGLISRTWFKKRVKEFYYSKKILKHLESKRIYIDENYKDGEFYSWFKNRGHCQASFRMTLKEDGYKEIKEMPGIEKRRCCVIDTSNYWTDTLYFSTHNSGNDSDLKYEVIEVFRDSNILNLRRYYNNNRLALFASFYGYKREDSFNTLQPYEYHAKEWFERLSESSKEIWKRDGIEKPSDNFGYKHGHLHEVREWYIYDKDGNFVKKIEQGSIGELVASYNR